MSNGRFQQGHDPRRHTFTREDCVKGGRAAWARTMAELRLNMGLHLPTEQVRQAARKLLRQRRA